MLTIAMILMTVINWHKLPPVLKAKDLTEILRCSTATLYRMIKANRIPAPLENGHKGHLRWSRESIESFLNAPNRKAKLPRIETPSQRSKRVTAARASLQQQGVKMEAQG